MTTMSMGVQRVKLDGALRNVAVRMNVATAKVEYSCGMDMWSKSPMGAWRAYAVAFALKMAKEGKEVTK
jgi:hypothetical protein